MKRTHELLLTLPDNNETIARRLSTVTFHRKVTRRMQMLRVTEAAAVV